MLVQGEALPHLHHKGADLPACLQHCPLGELSKRRTPAGHTQSCWICIRIASCTHGNSLSPQVVLGTGCSMGWPCFLQDIKTPNVLIKKWDPKVADVGLSQLLSRSFANSCSFGVGTFSWAATELLLGSHPVSPFQSRQLAPCFAQAHACKDTLARRACSIRDKPSQLACLWCKVFLMAALSKVGQHIMPTYS